MRSLKGKRMSGNTDLNESFKVSFEYENLNGLVADVADLGIDQFINSDIVNSVPVIRLLNSIYNVYKNIQTYRLARKMYLFLYHTREIPVEKKQRFMKEFLESNKEEGVDALLSVIDKLDNLNKINIIANLLKAKVDERITIKEFNRLVACLGRIPYSDLTSIKDYEDDYYEPGVTEVLYTAGLLFLSSEDFENNTNLYKLNYNGAQLLKYGLGFDIDIPKDFRVKRLSFTPVEDVKGLIDQKIDNIKPYEENGAIVFPKNI